MTALSLLPVLVMLAVAIGTIEVVQTGVNASLARVVQNSALFSSVVSMTVGFVVLLAMNVVLWVAFRTGVLKPNPPTKFRLWELLGGVIGALMLTVKVAAAPHLGYEVFALLQTSGQLTSSVVIDHVGFLGIPTRRATQRRLLGLAIALTGLVLTSGLVFDAEEGGEGGETSGGNNTTRLGVGGLAVAAATDKDAGDELGWGPYLSLCALAFGAGLVHPLQANINLRLAQRLSFRITAPFVSFVVAAVATLAAHILTNLDSPWDRFAYLRNAEFWMFFGGPCGVAFVTSSMLLVRPLGSGLFFVSAIFGTLAMSVVFDALGLFGFDRKPPTAPRVCGALLVVIAGVLISGNVLAKVHPPGAPGPAATKSKVRARRPTKHVRFNDDPV